MVDPLNDSAGIASPPDVSRVRGELDFSVARSGGPGGQHVNKVNSKVILKFNIPESKSLTHDEKLILLHRLSDRLTKNGVLVLSAQSSRSQMDNKQLVIQKLDALMRRAFIRKRVRKKTKPSKAAGEKRLQHKRKKAEKKRWRRERPGE